ncbi:MAG: SocA family protein [Acidobacteria bacterium]|nr:SocA family protein [Acidobacteriota bacterium]
MFDGKKFDELVLIIANHPNVTDLGLTKLYKLLYFAEAECLRASGNTITGAEFIKYEHGPVPSRGEKQLKALKRAEQLVTVKEPYGTYFIERVIPQRVADRSLFDAQQLAAIEQICQRYGNQTATYLSELSHQEPAWHYAALRGKLSLELMAYGQAEDPDEL